MKLRKKKLCRSNDKDGDAMANSKLKNTSDIKNLSHDPPSSTWFRKTVEGDTEEQLYYNLNKWLKWHPNAHICYMDQPVKQKIKFHKYIYCMYVYYISYAGALWET